LLIDVALDGRVQNDTWVLLDSSRNFLHFRDTRSTLTWRLEPCQLCSHKLTSLYFSWLLEIWLRVHFVRIL
jgi:hypothetical protein